MVTIQTVFFLLTPASLLAQFTFARDRQYFAAPVRVVPLYSCVETRLLYVHDPVRGDTYPAMPANVVAEFRLTRRQRKAAGLPAKGGR
jgi:hypothetical protein